MAGKGRDLVGGVTVPDGMTVDCQGNLYVTEHAAQRLGLPGKPYQEQGGARF